MTTLTTTDALLASDRRYIWHPFTQAGTAPDPIPVARAHGAVLEDTDGNEHLDMISSWWTTLHGHAQPEIVEAIHRQAQTVEQVIFAGNTHAPAAALSERLAHILPGGLNRTFFSDNGSTAVEVALKMALQYCQNVGDGGRTRFLAFDGGYHGDTVGAMSAGVSSQFFDPFTDLLFPVDVAPIPATFDGDDEIDKREQEALAQLDAHLEQYGATTAAAIVEPLVQGAGGMRMHRPGFLRAVVERLRRHGVLVIFDEVMTGFGRLGELFACLKAEVTPDLVCLSKGLTGGFLPMALTVAQDSIHDAFLGESLDRAFLHGHSFTANPLACAAALASLELLESDACTRRRGEIEAQHRAALAELTAEDVVTRPRVCGTLMAFDVDLGEESGGYRSAAGPWLKRFFRERGLLIRPLGNVVYLMPPFGVTDAQLATAYAGIREAVRRLPDELS